jgi:hypothetical protein
MAEPSATASEKPTLYTLSEVSKKTKISMPTLQRYKKTFQSRIPSVGSGRKQRYPEHALPVFEELRSENASRRGRPRKKAGSGAAAEAKAAKAVKGAKSGARKNAARTAGRPAAAKAAGGRRGAGRATAARRATGTRGRRAGSAASGRGKTEGLLTLTQISEETNISYPTLVRYVRLYSDRLPHEGQGRARRFYPAAVAVFRSLRQESGRGGRKAGSGRAATGARRGRPAKASSTSSRLEGILAARIRDLERFQQAIEKRFGDLVKGLQKLR